MNRHLLEGRHLLVVEDEMLILMILEDMLDDLGCGSVTTAATVEDGLELAAHHAYDAALLDVNLGGSKSYPIAAVLAARGTPFAFSTGYPDHGKDTAFSDRPVLRKPYRREDLSKVCADWFPPP